MLSATHTMNDVQDALVQDYDYFGLDSFDVMDRMLGNSARDVMYQTMYGIIGTSAYEEIQDKDKTDLETYETMLYWGEVHLICADFLGSLQTEPASSSISTDGYSYSQTGNTDQWGSLYHFQKASDYFANIGIDLLSIEFYDKYKYITSENTF